MEFADSVLYVREQLKLSQEKLARQLGISFSTVNRWENGKSFPSYLARKKFDEFCKLKGIVFPQSRK